MGTLHTHHTRHFTAIQITDKFIKVVNGLAMMVLENLRQVAYNMV